MLYTHNSILNRGFRNFVGLAWLSVLPILLLVFGCQKEEDISLPLSIVSTNIANDATDVGVFSSITVTFSDEMDASSVNENSFIVKKGQYPVYGKISSSGNEAVFKPSQQFADNKEYNCTITTEVKGVNGQSMTNDYQWSFTSGEEPDLIAPTISSHIPLDSEMLVFTDSKIQVSFSEVMDSESISSNSFVVKNGNDAVSGTFTYEDKTVLFVPDNTLEVNTTYTCVLTTEIKDLASNKLTNELEWSFATVPEFIGFNDIVKPIFTAENCNSCHNENRDPDLRDGYEYNSLINGQFVDVNKPEDSRIIEMLNGDYHESFTSKKEKRLILEWIKQGAKDN